MLQCKNKKKFFIGYLNTWYPEIYAAVMASPNTKFYKQVAAFTKAFLDVEAGSFEMI